MKGDYDRTILQRLATAFQASQKVDRSTTYFVAIGKPAEAKTFGDLADVFVEHALDLFLGNFSIG